MSETPPVGWSERLLVIWLVITFTCCVFASLPDVLTEPAAPSRQAARSYLRSIGLDQYWRMFVGDDWDIPQLRVIATEASHPRMDVTYLLLESGMLYRYLLDDRMMLFHFAIARGDRRQVFDHYADVVRARLGSGISEVRFEAVYRTQRVRPASGIIAPATVVPLADYRWDGQRQ